MANYFRTDLGGDLIVILNSGTAPLYISSATLLQLKVRKPGSTSTTTYAAEKVTDGSDGKLHYVWKTGELDAVGIWSFQVYVETPTLHLHSDVLTFEVGEVY